MNEEVTKYRIVMSSNGFNPRIWLFNGKTNLGQCVFVKGPVGHGADSYDKKSNTVTLVYRREHLPVVIDILRNEKPVYLQFNGASGGYENMLITNYEDTGEGE